LRLLRQVPPISELSQIDPAGRERVRVSRTDVDVLDSQEDFSQDPKFVQARANRTWDGPVYFRPESEPYMTLARASARRDTGVSVAEVNLKFIWDVVSQIRVGKTGNAFVVDGSGRLIAHPDISLVLRKTDLSHLSQLQAARAATDAAEEDVQVAHDLSGRRVLTTHAPVKSLNWQVFVELPVNEAYTPLYDAIRRSALLLLGALLLACVAGLVLARRMAVPIQPRRRRAARIGRRHLGPGREGPAADAPAPAARP